MERDAPLLNHPHDFFRMLELSVKPNTCFVMMPFAPEFTLVYETIRGALEGLMICKRADDLQLGHPILERILRGIATAGLIVADLTNCNPNVFYELGIAHTRTRNVLLLTRDINTLPFDLAHFFCKTYDLNSEAGIANLKAAVREAAQDVLARQLPESLEGNIGRTTQIVHLLRQRLESPGGVKDLVIRIHAAMSSIANWGRIDSTDPTALKYGQLLEEERELLIRLIEGGAVLRAIVAPQVTTALEGNLIVDRTQRLSRLLEFLCRTDDCAPRTEFVLSPSGGTNLMFIGDEVLFEGYKTGVERGFGWTAIYTDANFLKARTRVFDSLFESARAYTLHRYPDGSDGSETERLRRNVIRTVEESLRASQAVPGDEPGRRSRRRSHP